LTGAFIIYTSLTGILQRLKQNNTALSIMPAISWNDAAMRECSTINGATTIDLKQSYNYTTAGCFCRDAEHQ